MTDFTHHTPKVLTEADADLAGLPRAVSTDEVMLLANWCEVMSKPPHSASKKGKFESLDAALCSLVSERDALAGRVAELEAQNEAQKNEWLSWNEKRAALEKNAARYEWIRYGTGGNADHRGRQSFVLPDPHPLGNILKGSVAQHLDAAIDAAALSATTPESKP